MQIILLWYNSCADTNVLKATDLISYFYELNANKYVARIGIPLSYLASGCMAYVHARNTH